MKMSVVIPTFRRPMLLDRALASLFQARRPVGLDVEICVVDNNSGDQTSDVVDRWSERAALSIRVRYLFEPSPGSSNARNAGIGAVTGELVGLIDDDEEIYPQWFETAFEAFQDPAIDFIGGPCLPHWERAPPAWLPIEDFPAVVGSVDAGPIRLRYGAGFPGILMSGNAVLRRECFTHAGLFATDLGRVGACPTCGEDADLYRRLIASGARGAYLPELAIRHWVPVDRMTKAYFRRWVFWHGYSTWRLEDDRAEPKWYGVARWRYRAALEGLALRAAGLVRCRSERPKEFAGELRFIGLLGMLTGRTLQRWTRSRLDQWVASTEISSRCSPGRSASPS